MGSHGLPGDNRTPTLDQLKWLAVLAPLFVLLGFELMRRALDPAVFSGWPGFLVLTALVTLGTILFAEIIFGAVGRARARLAMQNRELLALHDAGLAIVGELDLETVLQSVVDQARELVGARYGALSLVGKAIGQPALLVSGLTTEEAARIGPLPSGHGLLGVVLDEGRALRLDDLTQDPRSVGFPPNHPTMRSLLAVPIRSHERVVGNLYLTEKIVMSEFSADDEQTLARFATLAALAIENARLHRQVRAMAVTEERERIAREMHDSLAQVLGYVNTKAQATTAFLESGQVDRAAHNLEQLADSARAAYADVREGILGLRTSLGADRGLLDAVREYIDRWQTQSGVMASLIVEPSDGLAAGLSPLTEVQLLRVVQEALANVRKHANATRVDVRLSTTDDAFEAIITDDGAGFDPGALGRADVPRFGLATMRERALAVGGTFQVDAAPGRGTRVAVRIPTDPAAIQTGAITGAGTDR